MTLDAVPSTSVPVQSDHNQWAHPSNPSKNEDACIDQLVTTTASRSISITPAPPPLHPQQLYDLLLPVVGRHVELFYKSLQHEQEDLQGLPKHSEPSLPLLVFAVRAINALKKVEVFVWDDIGLNVLADEFCRMVLPFPDIQARLEQLLYSYDWLGYEKLQESEAKSRWLLERSSDLAHNDPVSRIINQALEVSKFQCSRSLSDRIGSKHSGEPVDVSSLRILRDLRNTYGLDYSSRFQMLTTSPPLPLAFKHLMVQR
jgi:hypothetical protein